MVQVNVNPHIEVRLVGRQGQWVDVDVTFGNRDEQDTWNRQPILAIPDEGFDGIHALFWTGSTDDVDDMLSEVKGRALAALVERFSYGTERGYHYFGHVAEWKDIPVKDCDECEGDGACTACDTPGDGDCEDCGGDGRGECSECYAGACSECGGDGKCGKCGGGDVKCEACGGTNTCDICDGSGDCVVCDGSGDCVVCDGSDEEDCGVCDGDGDCVTCEGSGNCVYCDGSGKVETSKLMRDIERQGIAGTLEV